MNPAQAGEPIAGGIQVAPGVSERILAIFVHTLGDHTEFTADDKTSVGGNAHVCRADIIVWRDWGLTKQPRDLRTVGMYVGIDHFTLVSFLPVFEYDLIPILLLVEPVTADGYDLSSSDGATLGLKVEKLEVILECGRVCPPDESNAIDLHVNVVYSSGILGQDNGYPATVVIDINDLTVIETYRDCHGIRVVAKVCPVDCQSLSWNSAGR